MRLSDDVLCSMIEEGLRERADSIFRTIASVSATSPATLTVWLGVFLTFASVSRNMPANGDKPNGTDAFGIQLETSVPGGTCSLRNSK